MISYADVEKSYRQERTSPLLQKIPAGFYTEARELSQSPQVGDYKDTILEYLRKIYEQRSNKIIHYAGRAGKDAKPPENIIPDEMQLYNDIMKAVEGNRTSIFEKPVEILAEEVKTPTLKVRMKQPLPAIVGSDMREYGPFKVDDVVELPQESAKMLIERNVAENA